MFRRSRLYPLAAAVASAWGVVPAAHAAGNVITPNGRTATHLSVHGNVTDITTGTRSGANAFNAFDQFREGAGQTVNLRVPTGASNLINLVYGGRTVIDGVLNAYKNGQIGGHVTFADPQGLLVGSTGVVNVGSLTVSTPTKAFMNRMLGADGHIDGQAVGQLLSGSAPQSSTGHIDIAGHVNAMGAIDLQAAQVLEASTGSLSAGDADRARGQLFRATVNTQGLQQATQAVAHNGVVRIQGSQSVELAGGVKARAQDGGHIGVTASQVNVDATASLDSSGAQGGGSIFVGGGPHGADSGLANARHTTVAAGASIDASALDKGNGGQVVVWSDSGTDFGGSIVARGGVNGGNGGQVEVSARHGLDFHGAVDTTAPRGRTGDLLLDPDTLYVVNSTNTSTPSANQSTSGGTTTVGNFTDSSPATVSYVTVGTLQSLEKTASTNITLEAFNKIVIGDGSGNPADLNLAGSTGGGVGGGLQSGSTLTLEAGSTGTITNSLGTTDTTGLGNVDFNSGSSIETAGGNVVIDAGTGFQGAAATDGTANLGQISTAGGDISVSSAADITLSSTLDASGGAAGAAGGTVDMAAGNNLTLTGATVDASGGSGTANGGVIDLAAANKLTLTNTHLLANAGSNGNGGLVTVIAGGDLVTGQLVTSANGGSNGGDGGFVEFASHGKINYSGQVNTTAPKGTAGTLLLDPGKLYIVGSVPSGASTATGTGNTLSATAAQSTPSYVTVATLQALGDVNITLAAFNSIHVGDTSAVDLKLGSGATAPLTSGQTLTLEAGGTTSTGLTSGSYGSGDVSFVTGSSIETSGGSVVINAAGYSVPSSSSAGAGSAGTAGTATLGSITTAGGDITVNAGGSISLPAGATLDSSSGSGAPGAIALAAAQQVANGSGLLTASTIYQSVSPVIANSATPTATAKVTIDGDITGGDISLSASAQAAAAFAGNPQETSVAQSLFKKLGLPTDTLLQAYQYISSATAKVTVDSGAHITGSKISLSSDAAPSIDLTGQNGLPTGTYLSALQAEINSTSTATIASGATITFNGTAADANALSVEAKAEPSMALIADSTLTGSGASVTVAYEDANVETAATIASGATIDRVTGAVNYGVDVRAENTQSYSVKSSASATTSNNTPANAGIAVAISNLNTSANAVVGADLNNASDVTVSAASVTDKNVTSAETDANASGTSKQPTGSGSSQSKTPVQTLLDLLTGLVQKKASDPSSTDNSSPVKSTNGTSGTGSTGGTSGTGSTGGTTGTGSTGGTTGTGSTGGTTGTNSTTGLSFGSALALGFGTQGASASIADNATVHASGNVVVDAANSSPGFHNLASSGTASTEATKTNNSGTNKVGVSMAAALSWQKHVAHAHIGLGASVTGARVAVGAQNNTQLSFLQPYNEAYTLAKELLSDYNKHHLSGTTVLDAWGKLAPTEQQAVQTFLGDLKTLAKAGGNLVTHLGSMKEFTSNASGIFTTLGPQALSDYNSLPTSFKDAWAQSKVGKIYNEIKASVTSPEGMTTYAQATSDGSSSVGIAGAINYLSFSNDTQAWIAPGATVTITPASRLGTQTFSTKLGEDTVNWDAPLAVQAENGNVVLDGAGNGFLKFFGVKPASGSTSVGVGGAFDWSDYNNTTRAWVSDGVTLNTGSNDVAVSSKDANRAFTFTPSGGKGGGYAGNGAVAITRMSDHTQSEIDRLAVINAGTGAVDIGATASLEAFTLSGALSSGQNAGVGVGVAVALIDPVTEAGVTDTSGLITAINANGTNPSTGTGDCSASASTCLSADSLSVNATTTAAVGTLAIAGASSGGSSSSSTSGSGSGSGGSGSGGLLGTVKGAFSTLKGKLVKKPSDNTSTNSNSGTKQQQGIVIGQHRATNSAGDAKTKLASENTAATNAQSTRNTQKNNSSGSSSNSNVDGKARGGVKNSLSDNYKKDPTGAASSAEGGGSGSGTSTQPKMKLSLAGSAAVNVAKFTTKAVLDGARIDVSGADGVSVKAVRSTSVFAAAGAGALTRMGGGGSSFSAAAAGTLGMNLLSAATTAEVIGGSSVTLSDPAADMNVLSLAGGEAVAAGVGVSINTTSGQKNLLTIAGSGSVTVGRDTTTALVNDSTIKNTGSNATGNAQVQAYDSTDIGTGSGSVSASGSKAGIGLAVTVAMTGDDTKAQVLGSKVMGFSGVGVDAYAPAQIVSVGAVGAFGTSSQQVVTLSGAVVVDEIANSTEALIGADSNGTASTVTASSNVSVLATSQDDTTLKAELPSPYSLPFDFSGNALAGLGGESMGGTKDKGQSSPTFQSGTISNSTPGASIIAVAGNLSAGSGKASVGISAVYGGVDNLTSAQVGKATVTIGTQSQPGSLTVKANDAARVISVAAGVGVTTGTFAGMGSFTVNNLGGSTTALIGDTGASSNLTTVKGASGGSGPTVDVTAEDGHTIWSVAGSFAYGDSVAAAAAAAVNVNHEATTAEVSHANVTASQVTPSFAALNVQALSSSGLYSGAIAGSGSPNVSLGGSIDVTFDQGSTTAQVDNSALTVSGPITVNAHDSGKIWDGAGAVSGSSSAALGIAAAVNVTLHHVSASMTATKLDGSPQAVEVTAERSGFIASGAVGAQGSSDVAGGLAAVANVGNDHVTATVDGLHSSSGANSPATPASLAVLATDSAQVYSIGGEFAGSGSAAAGGAVTVNWLGQTVSATLSNSYVTTSAGGPAPAIDVEAKATGKVGTLAAAVGGAGDVALAGAFSVNVTSSHVSATASGDTLSASGVTVHASDQPEIDSLAIGLAGSGAGAAGVGVAVNRLGDTVSATLSGGTVTTSGNNVVVSADGGRAINTLAAGVALSGEFSAAGSLVTNVLTGTTDASIGGGAQVTANNNVAVLAVDNNSIMAGTGALSVSASGAGIGLGVAVNVLNDTTKAHVDGSSTQVNALAKGTNGFTVPDGTLTSQPSVTGFSNKSAYTSKLAKGVSLAENTEQVHGLAINAQSQNSVVGISTSVSMSFDPFGSVALSASSVTNVLGGHTLAYSDGATLDNGTGAKTQQISVLAGRHDFSANLVLGVAAGASDVSASGAFGVTAFNSTTQAYVQGGTVNALGAVTVDARGSQDSVGLGAGLSASLVGLAGTGMIDIFSSTTQAYAQGGNITAASLTVNAHDRSDMNLVSGAAAAGGGAGAATLLVVDGNNTTQAWVGDSGASSNTTTLTLTGALDVGATSDTSLWTLAVSGAAAGGYGIAGQVSTSLLTGDTEAHVYHAKVNAASVGINADNTVNIDSYAGAVAAGGTAGVGAGASVVLLQETVAAGLMNSTVTTSGSVDVKADSNKNLTLVSAAGGAGGSVGIGGAVGLVVMGAPSSGGLLTGKTQSELGSTVTKQSSMSNAGNSGNGDSTNLSSTEQSNVSNATKVNLLGAFNTPVADATTATVSGGTVTASKLTVQATDETSSKNVAGAAGIGGALGAGAGVALTWSYDSVGATIANGATVNVTDSATVTAKTSDGSAGPAVEVHAIAGGASLGLGLGAAIAVGTESNTVTAGVTGSTLTAPSGIPTLTIAATDGETDKVVGMGASLGAVSVGLVSANALRSSSVTSSLGGSLTGFGAVNVNATGNGAATASATGASAGIYSGNGAEAYATDSSSVTAETLSGASITGHESNTILSNGSPATVPVGSLTLDAVDNPYVNASALGVDVGAAALGASVAIAKENGSVMGQLDGTSTQHLHAISVTANATPNVKSDSTAGTGGLVAGQAVYSEADNNINVTSQTLNGVTLEAGDANDTGNVTIGASQTGTVNATADGVLAGVLAAGAVVVHANATPVVNAELGSGLSTGAIDSSKYTDGITGTLAVLATGTDNLTASSTSGAGGLGAGNAALSETSLNATTTAQTAGTSGTLQVGAFTLRAHHSGTVNNTASSTNVSLAGGGAGKAQNTINSTVKAIYGSGTLIDAGSATLTAINSISKPASSGGWDANGAAGGGINYNSITSTTSLDFVTRVEVNGGTLAVVGDPANPTAHTLIIGTENTVNASQTAKVATGGVVQGLKADAEFSGTVNYRNKQVQSAVDIASGATVTSSGNVRIYSSTGGTMATSALAHTWGGAGVVDSAANTTMTAYQQIAIDGTVRSQNNIFIGSGYNSAEATSLFSVLANSHAYNDTVLALHTKPTATATLLNNNAITVNSGGKVEAGGSATLWADRGVRFVSGTAIGQNSYQKIVSEVANFFGGIINGISHAFGGKTVVKHVSLKYHGGSSVDTSLSSVTVAGLVEAGLAGTQNLTLTGTGSNITAASGSSPLIRFSVSTWDYYQYLENKLARIESERANTTNTSTLGRLFFEAEQVNNQISSITDKTAAQNETKITLSPIRVASGNINIRAQTANTAGGTLETKPITGVTIKNPTPAFLEVGNITVAGGSGGQIVVNGSVRQGTSTGNPPQVSISSTYTNQNNKGPDIFLNGSIYNPTGPVTVTDSAGSIHNSGTISGGTVHIAALNGAYFQGYESGFHAPGNVTPVTDVATVIAGGPVYIAAQYLNVDGLIQSGHDKLSVTLPSTLDSTIQTWRNVYNQGSTAWQNYIKANKLPVDQSTGAVRVTAAASISNPDIIPAFWNPKTNHIELNDAQSQPGRVYLYGSIFNTGSSSKIVAAGGLANITVTNKTSLPVVINGLDAGSANKGGLVQIIDTAKTYTPPSGATSGSQPSELVTEYHYNPQNNQITVYHYGAGATGKWGHADASTQLASSSQPPAGNQTQYNIQDNGGGTWYLASGQTLTNGSGGSYNLAKGLYRPSSSSFTVQVPEATGISYTLTYSLPGVTNPYTVTNVSPTNPAWVLCSMMPGICTATPSVSTKTTTLTQKWSSINAIVNADNPVGIKFVGQSQGHINVTSASGIWINKDITNSTGPISIDSTGGVIGSLSSTALIKGRSVTLHAANGLGSGSLASKKTYTFSWPFFGTFSFTVNTSTPSRALNVQLLNGGVLSAVSDAGDVNINAPNGGLLFDHINAPGGAVNLSAAQGIFSTSGGTGILSQGDLTLAASGGSIGSQTSGTSMPINLGGTLNVNSYQGVNLAQAASAGDLSVGQILAGGDVTLHAPGGSIVSALAQVTNQKTVSQLAQQWQSFGLTGTAATTEATNNLTHIVDGFKSAYQAYWNIRSNVTFTSSGGKLSVTGLTPSGYKLYAGAAAVANGLSPTSASLTQAMILTYVQNQLGSSLVTRYQNAEGQLGQLIAPTNPASTNAARGYGLDSTAYQGYLNSYQLSAFTNFVNSGIQVPVTTGASWTQDQLLHTVSASRVFGGAAAIQTQKPNIQTPGKVVLISATGTGNARVGGFAAPVTIQLPSSSTGTLTLTDAQAAALAAAAPGDATLGSNASGQYISIAQFHPFYEQGASQVNVTAGNGVYLSTSNGDLQIGNIASSAGSIRLYATNNMLQTGTGVSITGGPSGSVLRAAGGTIGSSAQPLMVDLTGPLDSAKAGSGVYIEQTAGNLDLGNFASGGTGWIKVDNGSLNSIFTDASVQHVLAGQLDLYTPNGAVGSGVPLAVTITGGALSGQVNGLLNVVSPTADLSVANLTVGGPVTIDSVLGNLTVASLSSATGSGNAVTLSAGGAIAGNSTSGADVTAKAAGAQLVLTGDKGIGSASRALVIDAPILQSATSTGGDIHITDLESLSVPGSVLANNGSIDLGVNGNLQFATLNANNNLTFNAQGAVTGTNATAVTGNLDGQAGTDLSVTHLNAGGTLSATAHNGNMDVTQVGSGSDLSLTSSGTMHFATVTSRQGSATLDSGQALTGTTATAGRNLTVTVAQGDMALGTGTAGGQLGARVEHGNLQYTTLSGYQGINLNVSGTLTGQQTISKGGSVTAVTGGNANYGTLVKANPDPQNVLLKSGGTLTFGSVRAGGLIQLISAGAEQGTTVESSGGNISGEAGGSGVQITSVTTPDSATFTAPQGAVTVGTLTAGQANLSARNDVDAHQAYIERLIQFHSTRLKAHVTQQAKARGSLGVGVTGWHGGVAQQVDLTIDAPNGVVFHPLDVGTGALRFTSPDYTIASGYVSRSLSLVTPESSVLMNNIDTTLRHVDVQLYQPRQRFFLGQRGKSTDTNAFVLHYVTGYRVAVPNYFNQHSDTPTNYVGGSGYMASSQSATHGGLNSAGLFGLMHGGSLKLPRFMQQVQHTGVHGGVNVSFRKGSGSKAFEDSHGHDKKNGKVVQHTLKKALKPQKSEKVVHHTIKKVLKQNKGEKGVRHTIKKGLKRKRGEKGVQHEMKKGLIHPKKLTKTAMRQLRSFL